MEFSYGAAEACVFSHWEGAVGSPGAHLRKQKALGSQAKSGRCIFSPSEGRDVHWLRIWKSKINTLWILLFPYMVSWQYNSITETSSPFQKQLEPDFNWAARQLSFPLIWLSHSQIAFDDQMKQSQWDNHLQYNSSLILILSSATDLLRR